MVVLIFETVPVSERSTLSPNIRAGPLRGLLPWSLANNRKRDYHTCRNQAGEALVSNFVSVVWCGLGWAAVIGGFRGAFGCVGFYMFPRFRRFAVLEASIRMLFVPSCPIAIIHGAHARPCFIVCRTFIHSGDAYHRLAHRWEWPSHGSVVVYLPFVELSMQLVSISNSNQHHNLRAPPSSQRP